MKPCRGMILLNDKWILRSLKLTTGEYFMNTVRRLLQDRVQEVSSVEPDKTAHDAMEMMSNKKIGALPVLEAGKLVGIISERDYPVRQKR